MDPTTRNVLQRLDQIMATAEGAIRTLNIVLAQATPLMEWLRENPLAPDPRQPAPYGSNVVPPELDSGPSLTRSEPSPEPIARLEDSTPEDSTPRSSTSPSRSTSGKRSTSKRKKKRRRSTTTSSRS